jgi:uncharacterized SAM-binding protein YcdF (DUF218 family)
MSEINRVLFVPGYWDTESPILKHRLRETYDLWWGNKAQRHYDWIIVSGGVTRPNSRVSEGEFMKDWLVKHAKIPSGRILMECASRDSYESVRNVVRMYLGNPMYLSKNTEVTIVSQQEHANRLRVTFEAYGIRIRIVPVPGYSVFRRLLEWSYLYYTLYDPKGDGWLSKWKAGRPTRMLGRT